ncbi:hypothetical protein ACFUJR_23785 [Streptomyces sp. NPDC057271]
MPIPRVETDVAEAGGDLCDSPESVRVVLEQGKNVVSAAPGGCGVPVIA